MNETNLLQEKDILQQLDVLRGFEKELMVHLDNLACQLPEIYQGYANLVRETFDAAFDIISVSYDKREKIGLAVEVLSRGIQAYGAYKAAKEHNAKLDKYLRIKQDIARLNKSKVYRLRDEIERKLPPSEKLFDKFTGMEFDLSNLSEDLIVRQGNLALKYLTLYRTNCFLWELSQYLIEEFEAWSQGEQTSEVRKPDYYAVNGFILDRLYGVEDGFEIIEETCEKDGMLTGAEIMMLADPQLSLYSLQNTLCDINLSSASPAVRSLMESNPAFGHYTELTGDIKAHFSHDPTSKIWRACSVAALAVILLVLFYFPEGGYRWWVLIVGLLAIFRIGRFNSLKSKINHVAAGEAKTDEIDAAILQLCGHVDTDEIDYERKDTTAAFIKGFFNA